MIKPYKVQSWLYALKITNWELYGIDIDIDIDGLYVIVITRDISSKTQKCYAHIIVNPYTGQMYKD
jgi:hypothetical protein